MCVQVGSTSADFQPDERDPEVDLVLTENDYTLKMWPYKFKAVSIVTPQQARASAAAVNPHALPGLAKQCTVLYAYPT